MNNERMEKLFSTTLDLFQKQGFYHTPMSQIAKISGISMGSIYNQFKNKETLLNELYKAIKFKFADAVNQSIDTAGSIEAQIKRLLLTIYHYSLGHRREIDFAAQYENSPLIRNETQADIRRAIGKVAELYEKGRRTAVLSDLPTRSLIVISFGAVSALAKMAGTQEERMGEDELHRTIDAIFRAVAAGK
ncbi:MAG: TetR/AcrR family transcriptional regulator [Sporolactobacillus sp.]|nr:TetR/AcrR family transcriptional regulator [Sporolactobacillus sp.]